MLFLEERVRFLESVLTQMLEAHPEICPHNYKWIHTTIEKNGKQTRKYVCTLCGKEEVT